MTKVDYDGVGDTLSILFSKEQIVYAEEHGAVIVNFNEKGKPAEIEILNASKFMGDIFRPLLSPRRAKHN